MKYLSKEKIKKKKMSKVTVSFIIVMLAYPLAHFAVFWAYVNFNTIVLTFQRFDLSTGKYIFIGFENYVSYFKALFDSGNNSLMTAVTNSFLMFPFANFFVLPLTIIFSYFLHRKILLYKFYRVVFFLPSILSIVVLTMVFKFMIDSSFGPFDYLLKSIGLGKIIPQGGWLANVHTAYPTILVFLLWSSIGYAIILLSGAISRIPESIFESARLDGIGNVREMTSIIIPLIAPTISTIFILNTIGVFTFFLQARLLTNGGPNGATGTISMDIINSVEAGLFNWAATEGVIFSLLAIPLILILKQVLEKILPSVEY